MKRKSIKSQVQSIKYKVSSTDYQDISIKYKISRYDVAGC